MIKKIRNFIAQILTFPKQIKDLLIDNYLQTNLFNNPKYILSERLNKYEFQVFSQNGEDGIIEEIFNRIGITNKFFVEFGVEDGLETNTTYLLYNNWHGLWLEGSGKFVKKIRKNFINVIDKQLSVRETFITAENIEEIFLNKNVPKDLDLLSIDIDGNDYYVWNAIKNYNPRVVIIEYNSSIRPNIEWRMKYNPTHVWDGSMYFNSSLKSLEVLGNEKGYKLVGCTFNGTNAFFVRNDLVKGNFGDNFTAEYHYEPARYFLIKKDGHRRGFGEWSK